MSKRIAWQMLVWAVAGLAVWGARKATRAAWSKVSDSKSTTWMEAVSMAVVLAVAASLARKLARRGAEGAWTMATGEAPPGA